jgi:dimethylsulfone monooxygenase
MAIRFGYWMPLGSGGFVISNIPQRTDWSLDYNAGLAQTAEQLGFEYGLAPARFIASHGWELQQEARRLSSSKQSSPAPIQRSSSPLPIR